MGDNKEAQRSCGVRLIKPVNETSQSRIYTSRRLAWLTSHPNQRANLLCSNSLYCVRVVKKRVLAEVLSAKGTRIYYFSSLLLLPASGASSITDVSNRTSSSFVSPAEADVSPEDTFEDEGVNETGLLLAEAVGFKNVF